MLNPPEFAAHRSSLTDMLPKEAIEVEAKPQGLSAREFAIRQVKKDSDEDTGWRFQAIVSNRSASALTDFECALRYYDSGGHFVGLDEGYFLGADDLDREEDKSVSIDLDIPASASKAIFSIKAKKTNFFGVFSRICG